MKSSSELEGIENGNIQVGDVGGVACHQCHAMDFGGCRQKAVDNRPRAAGVEPAPNRVIDRQNVFAKGLIDGYKPVLNRVGLKQDPPRTR